MEKKDIGELVYKSMLQVVFLEFYELLTVHYAPRLSLQFDEAYVKAKIDGLLSIGKSRSNVQKKRAKNAIMTLEGAELITFLNGCFEEQKIQLLRQLRRVLGETPEYTDCETFLTEVVEEEKDKIKKLIKKELKNE